MNAKGKANSQMLVKEIMMMCKMPTKWHQMVICLF